MARKLIFHESCNGPIKWLPTIRISDEYVRRMELDKLYKDYTMKVGFVKYGDLCRWIFEEKEIATVPARQNPVTKRMIRINSIVFKFYHIVKKSVLVELV